MAQLPHCSDEEPERPPEKSQLQDLMDFTTRIVRHIWFSDDCVRFLTNLRSMVCLRTIYPGMGSEGIAM